jgi:hypothetical protein
MGAIGLVPSNAEGEDICACPQFFVVRAALTWDSASAS